jgi:hypothetical protein
MTQIRLPAVTTFPSDGTDGNPPDLRVWNARPASPMAVGLPRSATGHDRDASRHDGGGRVPFSKLGAHGTCPRPTAAPICSLISHKLPWTTGDIAAVAFTHSHLHAGGTLLGH